MKNWLHHLITVFTVGAAVQVTAQQAIAQMYLEDRNPTYPEHISDTFMRATYHEQRDTDTSFELWHSLNEYFGFLPPYFGQNSYPEHQAKRDIKKLDILYRDAMLQQNSRDPVLRTPDLQNPFSSSLRLESPTQNGSLQLLRGTEFSYDR